MSEGDSFWADSFTSGGDCAPAHFLFFKWLLLHFPLLNLHPEGAPNTEPTRAFKGGMSSHVSGRGWGQGDCGAGGAVKHNKLCPTFHLGDMN